MRFLWRTIKFENTVDYVMAINLFGKNDFPCVANYELKKCMKDHSNNFDAKTIEFVEKDFYMDKEKVKQLKKILVKFDKKLIEMYLNCSFRLTSCLSNAMSFIIHYHVIPSPK